MQSARLVLASSLLAILAGCGNADVASGPCAAMLATCIANQMSCVESGGAAHCEPCAAGQFAAHTGHCEAIPGTAVTHDFPDATVQSGEEDIGICESWTMNNPTEMWVTAVELQQGLSSHHSNWFFVPNNKFNGPDGQWRCSSRSFDELTGALAGGVLYAQSTQTLHEVQQFPNGAAVRIPPWSRIIGNTHFLNASPDTTTGHYHMAIYTTPLADVKVKLVPFHIQYSGLDIPAHAQSRFYGDCQVGEDFYAVNNGPWDLEVYYVLPHTHASARRFFVQELGGSTDGKSLIDLGPYDGESHGRSYDPPVKMGDAKGFRFGCEYDNQRDANIHWGFGDQEMCEFLGFGSTTLGFESSVGASKQVGQEGPLELYTGPCNSVTFAWDFNKPGGAPP